MSARETIVDYYEALHRGEPLYSYFAEHDEVVKVGVFSHRVGYDAVAEGLRDQTRTTENWAVESHDLRVVERPTHAWFADQVTLSWDDIAENESYEFETRWSGTLEPLADEWQFVGVHVSAPTDRVSD